MYLVEAIVNYSVHAVCVDAYLVLGYPDRQKSRVFQTEEQKLGKLGEGLEDSDLTRNGLRF